MKTVLKTAPLALGLIWLALIPAASAQCGHFAGPKSSASSLNQSGQYDATYTPASFVLASDHGDNDAIVGFWKVTFTAKGNPDIPDGATIDSALVVWHNDGTEIMNSGRPPQDGNFCLGVWEKVGRSKYKLNHFALGNDRNGNPAGPSHIVESISLSRDGNSYAGRFTLDAYDTSENIAAHVTGTIAATRITVHTANVF